MDDRFDEFLESVQSLDIFKKLKRQDMAFSRQNLEFSRQQFSRSLNLLVEFGGNVYVWDEEEAALIAVSLKELRIDCEHPRVRTLSCNPLPLSPVERLIMSKTGKYMALVCQARIWIMEMPSLTKQLQERVTCRSFCLGERYFATAGGDGQIFQVRWHPSSEADIHLFVLTSDSCLRIFNVLEPEAAEQTISLRNQPTALQSAVDLTIAAHSKAAYRLDDTDNVVDFDFGPERVVSKHYHSVTSESAFVHQLFILKENGDVQCLYPRLYQERYPIFLSDPLTMHPPAEDNYGVDACSLLCLSTTPSTLVVATAAGFIYHCVVLDQEGVDGEIELDVGGALQQTLYVYEGIDLEFGDINEVEEANQLGDDRQQFDDIGFLVLHEDSVVNNRYHCSHHAGVHTVTLSWLEDLNCILSDSDEHVLSSSLHLPCKVEHVVATPSLQESQLLPIVGVCVSTDRLIGIMLICVTLLGDCFAIRLLADLSNAIPLTWDTSESDTSVSPLRRLRMDDFCSKIKRMLDRTKLPLLRSVEQSDHRMSKQQLFRLLVEHTQMFRREISKLEQVRDEVVKRSALLKRHKTAQETELKQIEATTSSLAEKKDAIAIRCVEIERGQVRLLERLKHILRELQTQHSVLSDAEKSFGKELTLMETRLSHFSDQIERVQVKIDYRADPTEEEPKMVLSSSQNKQIRQILKDNGEMISAAMNELKRLKTESGL